MTHAKTEHASRQPDGDTALNPSVAESQQRLKAPMEDGLSWDDDGRTVVRPADEELPAAAFRDDEPPSSRVNVRSEAPSPASPSPARRSAALRWIVVLGLALAVCAGAYTSVRVARKLTAWPPTVAALGEALRDVAGEATTRLRTAWSAAFPRGAEAPPHPTEARENAPQ